MKYAQDVVAADLAHIHANLAAEFTTMAGGKLLITGGAGFLGYYLVQGVLSWNQAHPELAPITLTLYDNYIRGVPDWLMALRDDPNLNLVKHDITHPLPPDMPDFDYIIHAASIASPTFYRQYPIETMDANVNGLRSLLDYMRRQQQAGKPLRGFLFFSSSEIYGDPSPENIPTPETYWGHVSCTGPRACYDESKRYGETLCVNFARQYNLPIVSARPFNNFGPGLRITDRRVIPDFVRDVLNGNDIVLLSDGSPTRTFCYVADAVVGYYRAMINGKPGEAYNIGVESPEISMAELAERIVALARDLVGYQGKVVRQQSSDALYLVDNPNRRCPIITKARSEIGYNPTITLEDGLARAMIWYTGNREGEDA
ncbi:MAG: NAD-dependent epimerase/dehydratase family protein [Oscillochloridaceae bacterium umkhey_bin13]